MKISEFRQRYIEAMKMSERSKIAELFRLADDLESVEKDRRELSHIERCI